MKKIFALILILFSSCAYGEDFGGSSAIKLFPAGIRANISARTREHEMPEYDLSRMIQTYPDFSTYPSEHGIIWLKHVIYSVSPNGGTEITRLYVILGREGLSSKWLNWNIQIPAKGNAEVLEAGIYDFPNGTQITGITPEEDTNSGLKRVKFMGMPERYILVLSWREHLPDELSLEGLTYTQEDLRVWESVTEVKSSEALTYRTFPDLRRPETERETGEINYTWHRVNIDPYDISIGLARLQRSGIAFGTRKGNAGLAALTKESGNVNISAPSEAMQRYKRSGTEGLIEWLRIQPEIELSEGTPRKIPSAGAWTKREKVLLANSWLTNQKADAVLHWHLPFEPDDNTPVCAGMFNMPVIESGKKYYSMEDQKLLAGTKIYTVSSEGRFGSMRIPSGKSSDNRLSGIMDLRLNEQGMISGTVRIILRGAWPALMLGNNPTDGTARGAVLSLFPGLNNIKGVKYKNSKGVSEITFTIENKPGIGGTGHGVLALIPFFEPVSMRALGSYEPPVELKFPFIVEQNITLGFPKNAKEALISGRTDKNPDKINYSDNYQNRRHRLIAEARIELNMQSVSSGNMGLLHRCLDQWRNFSSRQIPVR